MSSRATLRQHDLPDQKTQDWDDLVNFAADTNAIPLPVVQTGPPSDYILKTWQDLLCDVEARLRLTSDTRLDPISMQCGTDTHDLLRSSAQECITAVNLLYITLKHERERHHQLEQAFHAATAALAQARSDLLGTRAEELRARHLATHDGLTALPNREFLHQRLTQALVEAETVSEPLAVMYLDLDGFKSVNDTYGHQTGDTLLKIVAARLTGAVRAEDLVSRHGGDEFVCLLLGFLGRDHLEHRAAKLFDAVSARCRIGECKITVRPSIGIAMYPADGATATTLLRHADAAMYAAKRERSGFVFFDRLTQKSCLHMNRNG